ncbi:MULTISPECIES: strictosidine synthase [unclassified Mesorhizobium]|uniref:strictosidine synthase n=1 Tax=unclassified Mesorhizobium TaxID=325217 RepID=UPI00112765E7|nr:MULTISPECIES: strictosidine synthase [unclassified Mesorhizobium]TPL01496.1 strictosidine synthase [Mesorhizobium sp. B2-4-16]TPL71226.1 strictosidine synthase [Mesorhizobium sp. B2-4-3]
MSFSRYIGGIVDSFMGGRGEHSITVPVMDGALKPNNLLERVFSIAMLAGADNLAVAGTHVLASSGRSLVEVASDGSVKTRQTYDADITFLAASAGGAIAVGLDGQGIAIAGGPHDGKRLPANIGNQRLNCPTAGVFADENTLVVCNGSSAHPVGEWAQDLLELGRSGSVLRIDIGARGASVIQGGLGYPSGVCIADGDRVAVSEAWRHHLLTVGIGSKGRATPLADLPAYPGRICPSNHGGYWLTMFAVRSQLQEFVLREKRYKREMMETVAPEYWIAPTLSSGHSFKEPLQAGGVIRLGIHKPWAPTRSYGLVVRLDDQFQPIWSAHSRADGKRHGITSCVEDAGRLLLTSKGCGAILALDHLDPSEPDIVSTLDALA